MHCTGFPVRSTWTVAPLVNCRYVTPSMQVFVAPLVTPAANLSAAPQPASAMAINNPKHAFMHAAHQSNPAPGG